MLTSLFWILSLLPGEVVEVVTVEQGVIQGEIESIDPAKTSLRVQGVSREFPNQDVVSIQWPGKQREKKVAPVLIELVNGDVLRGTVEGGSGERLRVTMASSGKLEIRIDFLRRLVFPKQAGSDDLGAFVSSDGKDRVYRRNGAVLDFLNGTVEGFEGKQISFRSSTGGLDLSKFSLDEIGALVLTPIEPPAEKKDLLALVDFADGSRISGKLLGVKAGKLEMEGSAVGRITVELKDILTIRFKNGRYVYLSDLDPLRVEEKVPFGGSDSIVFHYRKDLSVGGRSLRVGGTEFFRGLGVHSYSLLVFKLGKKYRLFRSSIGIDDEVLELGSKGSAVFRVLLDGKKAYESPVMRGGGGSIRIPDISLQGVEELSLEVDYADDLHVADRADWLEPLLVQ